MARKTVDELVKEKLAELTKATDEAHAVKKATVQDNVNTYNQQVDASVAQQTGIYEDSILDAERAEKSQLDDHYIDELVARKNLENTMTDMGLTDSGLNRGQQTAISVMRGNADSRARQNKVDRVQNLRDAINQVMIGGEQQKTAYQQQQSAALSEWYQNQLLTNRQNARTAAVEQYNAETEAIEKQQEAIRKQNELMLKNGYVQQGDSWVKDNTAERTTYAMTLIKNGTPEDEAWASAYYRYPTSDEKTNLYYAAYKDGVSRGYTGDALKAYANTGGGAAGKAAANEIVYSVYDEELKQKDIDPIKLTKFFNGDENIIDALTRQESDIEHAVSSKNGGIWDQSEWEKSVKKSFDRAVKNAKKNGLSGAVSEYAIAKAVGETMAKAVDARNDPILRNRYGVVDEERLATYIYNALGKQFSGDMLLVAAAAAGINVVDDKT